VPKKKAGSQVNKEIVAMSNKHNALKHGAYAEEFMLWGENYSDYESLRSALNKEWAPEGGSEEYLVQRLVKLIWRRQRLDRYEHIKAEQAQEEIRRQSRVLHSLEKVFPLASDFKRARTEAAVEELISVLDKEQASIVRSNWPLDKCELSFEWGPAIADGLSRLEFSRRYEGCAEFARIVELTVDDKASASEERLDASIDRTVKRLLQIKTWKQMYHQLEPKVINIPRAEVTKSEKAMPARIGETNSAAASASHSRTNERRRKR
jgi:hypothetical protein